MNHLELKSETFGTQTKNTNGSYRGSSLLNGLLRGFITINKNGRGFITIISGGFILSFFFLQLRRTQKAKTPKFKPENRGFTVDGALIEMVVVREEYEVLWCGSGLGEKKHLEG